MVSSAAAELAQNVERLAKLHELQAEEQQPRTEPPPLADQHSWEQITPSKRHYQRPQPGDEPNWTALSQVLPLTPMTRQQLTPAWTAHQEQQQGRRTSALLPPSPQSPYLNRPLVNSQNIYQSVAGMSAQHAHLPMAPPPFRTPDRLPAVQESYLMSVGHAHPRPAANNMITNTSSVPPGYTHVAAVRHHELLAAEARARNISGVTPVRQQGARTASIMESFSRQAGQPSRVVHSNGHPFGRGQNMIATGPDGARYTASINPMELMQTTIKALTAQVDSLEKQVLRGEESFKNLAAEKETERAAGEVQKEGMRQAISELEAEVTQLKTRNNRLRFQLTALEDDD